MDNRTREQKIESLVSATMAYYPWANDERIVREEAQKITDLALTETLHELEAMTQDDRDKMNKKFAAIANPPHPKFMREQVRTAMARNIGRMDERAVLEMGKSYKLPILDGTDKIRKTLLEMNDKLSDSASEETIKKTWMLLKATGDI